MKQQWKLIIILLTLILLTLVLAIITIPANNHLMVVACDVGQGDALLIQQSGNQIIVVGGEGRSVIDCLSRYMPFWDRTIEAVILTHPQADHYEGLIEVVRRYGVKAFVANEVNNSTQGYELLKKEVGMRAIPVYNPDPSTSLSAGLIYIDILYPSASLDISPQNVLGTEDTTQDLNNFSVVFNLHFDDFSMLFTGDIGPEVMDTVLKSGISDIDVLKVPHHGSKNGLTADILNLSSPEIAVISAGKKNRFGHPHQEILDLLSDRGVRVLRTDLLGDIVITTDGQNVWH